MAYPNPKIGYYYAECCLLDLYRIENAEDLAYVEARIADNDECGELMIFPTLADGIAKLRGEYDQETEAREFARLGWHDVA